MQEIVRNL